MFGATGGSALSVWKTAGYLNFAYLLVSDRSSTPTELFWTLLEGCLILPTDGLFNSCSPTYTARQSARITTIFINRLIASILQEKLLEAYCLINQG